MRRITVAAVLLLAACGGPVSAPRGPNGGENTLAITIDGREQDFDSVKLSLENMSATTLRLFMSGSADPYENAADDEYSILVDVELDRAELATLSTPADLAIAGVTLFPDPETNEPVMMAHQRALESSPLIELASVRENCFCYFRGEGTQELRGNLHLDRIADGALMGRLDLVADGHIPYRHGSARAIVHATFDLAL